MTLLITFITLPITVITLQVIKDRRDYHNYRKK